MMGPETLRVLVACGLTGAQLVEVAEAMSRDVTLANVTLQDQRAKNRERQKKWRERHAHNVTQRDAPPKKSPPDPLKESPPTKIGRIRRVTADIWAAAPDLARKRSSQKKLLAAVEDRLDHGADLEAMQRGCELLYADEVYRGPYAKAVDRVVRDELWRSFVEQSPQLDLIEQGRLRFIRGGADAH